MDRCGSDVIASTMLTLLPGELSTIIGGPAIFPAAFKGNGSVTTRQFNFRDLPCPPQSVMVISPKVLVEPECEMLIPLALRKRIGGNQPLETRTVHS